MKILSFLLLLITLVLGDKTMTIASYNVENLFDLDESGYEYQEYIPNSTSKWNLKNYRTKLKNLSKVIIDIDADIIALQEIESIKALKDLRKTLKQNGLYYQYYKIADRKNTTVKVAIFSKIPFVYTKEISVQSSLRFRNILESKFIVDDKSFYIFTNHWKSKSGPESMRIVSAKALLKRIKQIGYEENIILLGDFNSDYEEYKKFERKRRHNDTNGKTGINHVLKTISQTSKASEVKYEKNNFYNLWYDRDKEDRYTYIFRGKKESLDNMLISQPLLDKKGISYINDSMGTLDRKYLYYKKRINRWYMSGKRPRIHRGKGYSDHLPIVAKFSY